MSNRFSKELMHHGVKGMHWGVRRYQNKDGTLTSEGKKHRITTERVRNSKSTLSKVNSIVSTLSREDKEKLGADPDMKEWIPKNEIAEVSKQLVKRWVVENRLDKTPVSFVELWADYQNPKRAHVAVATRSGEKFRGKGYASRAVKEMKQWYDKYGHKKIEELDWEARIDNDGSIALAKKFGFEHQPWEKLYNEHGWEPREEDKNWSHYTYSKH